MQPSAQSTGAGTPVTFSVVSPNATSHRWQRSTNDGTTWIDVVGADTASLTLASPALIDSGTQYRAVATNEAGSTQSAAAKLTVNARLRLLAGALGGRGHADASGREARFDLNRGIALDGRGDLIIADSNNHVLRKMTPAGEVTTTAGTVGSDGRADGSAAAALLSNPRSVAVDAAGVIWFVDQGTCYLRKLADGVVSSVALLSGDGPCYLAASADLRGYDPAELAIGPDGDIFVSDRQRNIISRVDAAGDVSLYAGSPFESGFDDGPRLSARFWAPRGLAFDASGNLYVADSNSTIRRIDGSGNVTTIAGAPLQLANVDGIGTDARLGRPLALQVIGNVLVITDSFMSTLRVLDLTTLELRTIAGEPSVPGSSDGRGSAARFNGPYGVAGDNDLIYVSDGESGLVRTATLDGQVTTLAGQLRPVGAADGPGTAARFGGTVALAADAAGNLYAADGANHAIRKISPNGEVTTVAGALGVADWVDGVGAAARFNKPSAIAIDDTGNLIVADMGNEAIRKISRDGVVTTIAGGGPGSAGYVDGPGAIARFNYIESVSVDPAGNIFVADAQNCSIRKISPDGVVSTPIGSGPGTCMFFDGSNIPVLLVWPRVVVAIGIDDVLYVDNPNTQVKRIGADRRLSLVAGSRSGFVDGPAGDARFGWISALVRDANGNIYVADAGNHALRLIRPDSSVETLVHRSVNTDPGDNPSLRAPAHLAILPGNSIAISTEAAVVVD